MAGGGQLLTWDIPPKNGQDVYFSRDLYEKHSLSPSLMELMLLPKRVTNSNADSSQSGSGKKASQAQAKLKSTEAATKSLVDSTPFQEPRVPYPFFSSLTEKEQRRYLFLLSAYFSADPSLIDPSEQKDYSYYLQMKEFVSKEVAEFLKFAQNAARSCTKDYENLSEEATLYTKNFLSSRIGCVKRYPESYNLHEVTSIMGGKVHTELTLKFQKCLLALGKVSFIKFFPKLPAPLHLPNGHQFENDIPEQKAAALHHDVSTDPNAEKLAIKYRPHIVLTSESLYTLLNNYGLDYKEQWELPVSVKMVSTAGVKPIKLVFIDPPVLKKEVAIREKNHIFHEFLADFHMTKKTSVLAHALLLDKPPERPVETPHCHGRQLQVPDSCEVDFDTDVTELETFASTSKPLSTSKQGSSHMKPANIAKILPEHLRTQEETAGNKQVQASNSRDLPPESNVFCPPSESSKPAMPPAKPASISKILSEHLKKEKESMQKREKGFMEEPGSIGAEQWAQFSSEENCDKMPSASEAENLDYDENAAAQGLKMMESVSSCSKQAILEKMLEPSDVQVQEMDVPKEPCEALSKDFDPVGQILKLQTDLLESSSSIREEHLQVNPGRSLDSTPSEGCAPSKASVPSILEPGPNADPDTSSSSKLTWLSYFQGSQKEMLWDEVEDRSRYEPPQRGNLVYKLFSLDDMLLMVRCVVQKVEQRPRHKKAKVRRHFPVFALPKLEYQVFYGAEALTEGEMCRLWMESLLHSNSSFAIGHIDALTSKLFLLEQLSAEDLKKRFGTFKPASSLNILHHILKKVTGLQEGSYLLTHAAGDSSVTIHKSCEGNPTRASYNLHAAHADLPGVPSVLSVPWVPLDPHVPLPYHMTQGRVPCTFPPRPADPAKHQMSGMTEHSGTPSRRRQVSKEANNDHLPANPVRKRRGAAQKRATLRSIYRQANRGPNWKFWKESKQE